jgi:hypothetical protein
MEQISQFCCFPRCGVAGNGFHVIGMTAHRHGGADSWRAGNGFRAI